MRTVSKTRASTRTTAKVGRPRVTKLNLLFQKNLN